MRGLVLFILTFGALARAEETLTLQGVNWTAAGAVEIKVAAGKQSPVTIAIPRDESTAQSGTYNVTVKPYSVPEEGELMTIVLRRKHQVKASLYVLKRQADQNFGYLHKAPILDNAASLDQDLNEIFKGLSKWNECSQVSALLSLVRFAQSWPGKDLNSYRIAVETGEVKHVDGASCAEPPKPPAADKPVAKPARPAAPKRQPRARQPRYDYDPYSYDSGYAPRGYQGYDGYSASPTGQY